MDLLAFKQSRKTSYRQLGLEWGVSGAYLCMIARRLREPKVAIARKIVEGSRHKVTYNDLYLTPKKD